MLTVWHCCVRLRQLETLADPDCSACVDVLDLLAHGEQVDDRPDEEQASGEEPEQTAPDLPKVEVLQAGDKDETDEGESNSGASLFRGKCLSISHSDSIRRA